MAKRVHDCINEEPEQNRLQEADVFIAEYISDTSFTGIIKQRFSDFQVFEIDMNGDQVHLTSLENNLKNTKFLVEEPDAFGDVDVNEKPVEQLQYPLNDVEWKQLTLLMKRKKKDEHINLNVTGLSKKDRTSIHDQISKKYNGALCTSTENDGKLTYIVIRTNARIYERNYGAWGKDTPQYLHFVMYKVNFDTIGAGRFLCKHLKKNQKSYSYAGTKDRRGVTIQRVCFRQVTADRIFSLNQDNLFCGNFVLKYKPLKLGDLKGNHFVVALRNIESSDANIVKTLQNLKEKGFINYFGLQRFGVYSSAPTHEIGKFLLQNFWAKAINLILTPRAGNKDRDIQEAINMWHKTNDAKKAVKCVKRNYNPAEMIILKTLAKHGNTAYVNALQQVPRNIILLYIHAFQSLVWNRIVSRRIKKHGMKILSGDLIFASTSEDNIDIIDPDIGVEQEIKQSVRPITADEVNKISIFDVVYPLPGHAVEYPKNEIGDWYKEILAEYEIADFNGRNKQFTASGVYRKMLIFPKNVSWKIVYYNDPSVDLILTDLQKLRNENIIENLESGTFKAVILEFSLPCCSYATMALREVMKTETSANYQASLTTSHLQAKRIKFSEEPVSDL